MNQWEIVKRPNVSGLATVDGPIPQYVLLIPTVSTKMWGVASHSRFTPQVCGELVSPRPRFIFGYWGSQEFLNQSVSPPVFERTSSSRGLHHFLALVCQSQQLQGPVRVNMRAVRFHGRGDIRLDEVEEPICGSGQVKVRSTYRQ